MRVLVSGATGFIGKHLVSALHARGHRVVAASRRPERLSERFSGLERIAVDYRHDHASEIWLPRLEGVDAVVNAVGVFSTDAAQFDGLHTAAPRALFDACAQAGVRRVLQISALGANTGGANAGAQTAYHRSKHAVDEHLRTLSVDWTIVQPSLVYGPGGASARLFTTLASLPLIPLPGRGGQTVQPVHVDDLVAALVTLVEAPRFSRDTIFAVGPEPLALREMLARLRRTMGLGPARFVRIPMALTRAGARLGERLPGVLLTRDALSMLERGNQADSAAMRELLGRPPRPAEAFVNRDHRQAVRRSAQLNWLLPLLRLSIALVWLGSGVVSLGLYPVERSYDLLAGVGVSGALAPFMLYGAAMLDIALGVATLAMRQRHALWRFQIGLIVVYSAILTVQLPGFWLHPFGPLLKNLPMLAILIALLLLERR